MTSAALQYHATSKKRRLTSVQNLRNLHIKRQKMVARVQHDCFAFAYIELIGGSRTQRAEKHSLVLESSPSILYRERLERFRC